MTHNDCRAYRLFQNRTAVADFESLVASYEDKEFASPTRSTIPLLMMLREAPRVLSELLATLGVPSNADPSLHLEYKVDSPRGKGLPSHTDLMVLTASLQLAMEIKWGEPRYEDVAKWLGKEDSTPANKAERFSGWLQMLQAHAGQPLRVENFHSAVYQMVHRAASACEHPEVLPRLAYVLFQPHPEPALNRHAPYADDLRHLKSLLGGAPAFSFHLVEVGLRPTLRFEALRHLRKGTIETTTAVRKAVLEGGLFEFGSFAHQEITET